MTNGPHQFKVSLRPTEIEDKVFLMEITKVAALSGRI